MPGGMDLAGREHEGKFQLISLSGWKSNRIEQKIASPATQTRNLSPASLYLSSLIFVPNATLRSTRESKKYISFRSKKKKKKSIRVLFEF